MTPSNPDAEEERTLASCDHCLRCIVTPRRVGAYRVRDALLNRQPLFVIEVDLEAMPLPTGNRSRLGGALLRCVPPFVISTAVSTAVSFTISTTISITTNVTISSTTNVTISTTTNVTISTTTNVTISTTTNVTINTTTNVTINTTVSATARISIGAIVRVVTADSNIASDGNSCGRSVGGVGGDVGRAALNHPIRDGGGVARFEAQVVAQVGAVWGPCVPEVDGAARLGKHLLSYPRPSTVTLWR